MDAVDGDLTTTLAVLFTFFYMFTIEYLEEITALLESVQKALTLILAFLSIGERYTEGTEQTSKDCYELCPPGYHKEGDCDHPVAKYRCKKCTGPTYTALHNYVQKCERCGSCARNEVTIKPCTFNSNVVCDCKDGFYNANPKTDRRCLPCPQNSKDKEDGQFNRLIQKCLTNPECERICLTTTSTFMTATVSNSAPTNPAVDPVEVNSASYLTLIILVLVVVTVVGHLWLFSCPRCGMNKDSACIPWSRLPRNAEFNGNGVL